MSTGFKLPKLCACLLLMSVVSVDVVVGLSSSSLPKDGCQASDGQTRADALTAEATQELLQLLSDAEAAVERLVTRIREFSTAVKPIVPRQADQSRGLEPALDADIGTQVKRA